MPEKLCKARVVITADILYTPGIKVNEHGTGLILPNGDRIRFWLIPELTAGTGDVETYRDLSWDEATRAGVGHVEYDETSVEFVEEIEE